MELIAYFLLIAVAFYLLVLRPVSRQKREFDALKQLQSALEPGVRVMIASGIYGTIRSISDDTVMLEIAPNTQICVAKGAIAQIENAGSNVEKEN
ncbi:MAG: preprotein translocase subunit YajC [Aeromicrobium sp.]|nr:MAG: preprotein translocase subunit YajC [Aeromicrobium sp.]